MKTFIARALLISCVYIAGFGCSPGDISPVGKWALDYGPTPVMEAIPRPADMSTLEIGAEESVELWFSKGSLRKLGKNYYSLEFPKVEKVLRLMSYGATSFLLRLKDQNHATLTLNGRPAVIIRFKRI